ncbi:TonB-dependent receptor [Acetobacteraceae bacterium]|nr:TonB-dependent receptor [Acetobacteraceae bacterium]
MTHHCHDHGDNSKLIFSACCRTAARQLSRWLNPQNHASIYYALRPQCSEGRHFFTLSLDRSQWVVSMALSASLLSSVPIVQAASLVEVKKWGTKAEISLPLPSVRKSFDPSQSSTYQHFFDSGSSQKIQRQKIKRKHLISPQAEHFGVSGHYHPPHSIGSHNAQETIGRETLSHFVAGTNALEALALSTPGASFSSGSALGTDAQSNSFYLRGYDQDQLGASFDGIPMGDQTFAAPGAAVTQVVIQENLASVSASQGAGALDMPSSQTLGGSLTYTSLDPSDKFHVSIGQEFGSFKGYRTFGRWDSGRLNHTGTKFQASFLRNSSDLWSNGIAQRWGGEGRGFQRQEVVNFKAIQPISNFGKLSLTSLWEDSPQYNAPQNTGHMLGSLGYGDSNFYPDYNKAKHWASACKSGDLNGLPSGVSQEDACNLSYQNSAVTRVYLEALRGDFQISPKVKSSSIVYGQATDYWIGQANPTLQTPHQKGGIAADMAGQNQHFKGYRVGLTHNFEFDLGHRNHLKTGIWYENNRWHQPDLLSAYGVNDPVNNVFNLTNSGSFTADQTRFTTNTFQFYIENAFKPARNMTFTYGFKSLVQTTNGGTTYRASDESLAAWGNEENAFRPVYGRLTSSNAFLPHFNYDWHFKPGHEFYFDVAENMRPFEPGGEAWSSELGNSGSLGSAQEAFNIEKKSLRPERTWNYVVGYRYNGKPFSLGIDYYHTDYIGRLGTITTGSSVSTNISSTLANLGGEKMDGVDLIGVAHLSNLFHFPAALGQFNFMNSFSYSHDVYENGGIPTAEGAVSIRGVQQVFYPRYMYKTNLHYVNGRLGWDLNVNYNSKRNVTYTGDFKIPAYWSSEFTGFYLLGRRGKEDNLKLSFGITNLFGQHYVAAGGETNLTAQGAGNNAGTPNLTWAAPRSFFGTVNFAF